MKKFIIIASLLIACSSLSACVVRGSVAPGRGYYGGGCYHCGWR